jgi:ankyrin repeat protein
VPHHLPPVVDIGAVDYNGRTALVVAAESGRANLVRLLVALGADPNAADSRGLTPAQAAAQAAAQRWDVTDSQLSETLETLKELGWTGKAYDA